MVINDEDHDLIAGLKTNNEAYQKKLIDRYSGYLLSIALRQGLRREDALEVVNDVFHKVILRLNDFNPNRGCKFTTWLYKIATNSAIDKLRKTKQSSFEEEFQLIDEKSIRIEDGSSQRSDCPASEGSRLSTSLLIEVLDELSETDRILLLERSYDTPFKDIAILIGKTEGTAKVAHLRALEKLKNAYIAKLESKDEMTRSALKAFLN